MTDIHTVAPERLVALTGQIAASYIAHNAVPTGAVPDLLHAVHGALAGLGQPKVEPAPVYGQATPAQVRASILDEGLISFVDGRTYKTLKRHLTGHGLDPRSYRERYGLPADYPMVAPGYAAQRSAIAKSIGLGGASTRAIASSEADTRADASAEADTAPPGLPDMARRNAPLRTSERAAILQRAAAGQSAYRIAQDLGRSEHVVLRHGGDALRRRPPGPDVARLGAILHDYEASGRGGASEVADRYGYASKFCVYVIVDRARRLRREGRL